LHNEEFSAGDYEILKSGSSPSDLLVISRADSGETSGYGNISPVSVVEPSITVNDVIVDEDGGPATFTISLSQSTTVSVTVDYETTEGTATDPEYYTAKSGQVTFDPGQVSKQVNVTIIDNEDNEPDKIFYLDLTDTTWGNIIDSRGQCTITNDDVGYTPTSPVTNNLYMEFCTHADDDMSTAIDTSGNDRHATVVGSPPIVTGYIGNCRSYGTNNYYLDLGQITTAGWSRLTVSLWFKVASSNSGVLIGKDPAGTGNDTGSITCYGSNSIRFTHDTGSINLDFGSGKNVYDNQWHHVVAMRLSSGYKFVLDGDTAGQLFASSSATMWSGTSVVKIGIKTDNYWEFPGLIDQIRIFDRAIQDSEIMQLYNES
jgi:hypothetical protein